MRCSNNNKHNKFNNSNKMLRATKHLQMQIQYIIDYKFMINKLCILLKLLSCLL